MTVNERVRESGVSVFESDFAVADETLVEYRSRARRPRARRRRLTRLLRRGDERATSIPLARKNGRLPNPRRPARRGAGDPVQPPGRGGESQPVRCAGQEPEPAS